MKLKTRQRLQVVLGESDLNKDEGKEIYSDLNRSLRARYCFENYRALSDLLRSLETSAFQSLYDGQFTLSTPLINQMFVYHSPTDAAP